MAGPNSEFCLDLAKPNEVDVWGGCASKAQTQLARSVVLLWIMR